jgi:hypothetical protein
MYRYTLLIHLRVSLVCLFINTVSSLEQECTNPGYQVALVAFFFCAGARYFGVIDTELISCHLCGVYTIERLIDF